MVLVCCECTCILWRNCVAVRNGGHHGGGIREKKWTRFGLSVVRLSRAKLANLRMSTSVSPKMGPTRFCFLKNDAQKSAEEQRPSFRHAMAQVFLKRCTPQHPNQHFGTLLKAREPPEKTRWPAAPSLPSPLRVADSGARRRHMHLSAHSRSGHRPRSEKEEEKEERDGLWAELVEE